MTEGSRKRPETRRDGTGRVPEGAPGADPPAGASPSVEVALATYNGARFLPQLLDSLFAQTHDAFRIVVSDDRSSDDTLAIVEDYARRHPGRISIVPTGSGPRGPLRNFSSIIPHLTADYVLFCDQDDVWLPHKVAVSVEAMHALDAASPEGTPNLLHTDLFVVGEDLAPINPSAMRYQNIDPRRRAFRHLLMSNVATGCTVAANRALYRLAAPIPEEALMHDHWLALVAAAFGRIAYIDEPTILYRQHAGNAIGAKEWAARGLLEKVRSPLVAKRNVLRRYSAQAAALVERYGDKMREEDRRAAAALGGLWRASAASRFARLWKEGVLLQGVIRNVALLLTVSSGTPKRG